MIRFLLLMILSFSAHAADAPVKFELDGVPVSQVLRVIYSEALKTPYVLAPDVLADVRPVSFRYSSSYGSVKSFLSDFLDAMGYRVDHLGAVDYVRAKPAGHSLEAEKDVFVYRPKFRDGSYLAELLGPLFSGQFTVKRVIAAAPGDVAKGASVPPGSAAALVDRSADMLVFSGQVQEVAKLQKLLVQVDVPAGEVVIKGMVYEVQTGKDDASAFQLAMSLLNGKLGVNIGAPAVALASGSLSFTGASFSAVVSALSSDSRFKVVSSPSARVRSGSMARFTVGQDVPILGDVTFPQGSGAAVQSVKYQSSGVIFQVTPKVRDSVVDVDLSQQMSSFVNTTSGVNNSPTLTKRQMDTSVSIPDGDVIVLGGLTENKDSASSSGLSFLPSFFRSKVDSEQKTEILLFLQVTKI